MARENKSAPGQPGESSDDKAAAQNVTRAQYPDVILGPAGAPFANREAATADLISKGLDPVTWQVVNYGAGFAIVNSDRAPQIRNAVRQQEQAGYQAGEASSALTLEKAEYVRIQLRPAREGEDQQIPLIHNGDVIRVHRGVETIIPKRFLSCLNDSVVRKHIIRPGVGRKFVGMQSRHDFSVLGAATKADYVRMRDAGAAIQEQEMMAAALAAAGQQRLSNTL